MKILAHLNVTISWKILSPHLLSTCESFNFSNSHLLKPFILLGIPEDVCVTVDPLNELIICFVRCILVVIRWWQVFSPDPDNKMNLSSLKFPEMIIIPHLPRLIISVCADEIQFFTLWILLDTKIAWPVSAKHIMWPSN